MGRKLAKTVGSCWEVAVMDGAKRQGLGKSYLNFRVYKLELVHLGDGFLGRYEVW